VFRRILWLTAVLGFPRPERIKEAEGNDKMYTTLVPVQTQAEIDALKETDTFMLMTYFPRLQIDGGTPKWMGKG
jgi:hypothetical protein